MPDLSQSLLPRLQNHRIPGLDLGHEAVFPKYDDQSVLNIPASICRLLQVPEFGAHPLIDEILSPLDTGYRRVVLVLMDALALKRLVRWSADGTSPVWGSLIEGGLLAPLTSITPCTTSAALTSLWTGRSAALHGITGYEMWMKEYGVVANTILQTPMSFEKDVGGLRRAGFSPQKFLDLPLFGSHLVDNGVEPHAFQHASIIHSGLSQMFFAGVKRQAFTSASDLWVNVRELLEAKSGERIYAYVYWPVIDSLSHRYGPDDERTAAEFAGFSSAFERLFLEPLSPGARRDTLLILTADHGQVATALNPAYNLNRHPHLTRRLHLAPTGENRMAYLYVRPGAVDAVRAYIEQTWLDQFVVLESVRAIQAGLFGAENPHPALLDRVGDLIVVAKSDAYLWWAAREDFLLGRHGGLQPDEMLVPFLASRL